MGEGPGHVNINGPGFGSLNIDAACMELDEYNIYIALFIERRMYLFVSIMY